MKYLLKNKTPEGYTTVKLAIKALESKIITGSKIN